MKTVIALRQLHTTPPGASLEVRDNEAELLVKIGYAKWPEPASETPPVTRRRYQRRDLHAER